MRVRVLRVHDRGRLMDLLRAIPVERQLHAEVQYVQIRVISNAQFDQKYLCFVGGIIFSLNYRPSEARECAYVREVSTTCVCRLEWSYLSTVESSSLLYICIFASLTFHRENDELALITRLRIFVAVPSTKKDRFLYSHFILFLSINKIKSLNKI